MSSSTGRSAGWETVARSVARLTVASTPSILPRLRSIRALQDAHVMPVIARSTLREVASGSATGSGAVVVLMGVIVSARARRVREAKGARRRS